MAHALDALEFRFEGYLEDKSSRKVFTRYVSDICHCPEIFEFIDSVETLKQQEGKARKESAQKIIDQFIKEGSPKEINISNEVRSKTIREKHFDKAYDVVLSELKEDIFPRFVKSEVNKRHVSRLSKNTLSKIVNIRPEDTVDLNLTLNIVDSEENITKQDVKFLVDLSRNGTHWKLLNQGPYHAAYKTREKANINLSGRTGTHNLEEQPFYRVTGILQYPVEDVLYMLADSQYKTCFDNNLYTATQLDYRPSFTLNTYSTSITIENYPLAWPVSNRDFTLSNTIFRSTEGPMTFYIVQKPVDYSRAPVRKGTVRASLFAAWIIQRATANNSTKYTRIFYRNMLDPESNNNSKVLTFWNHINKKKANNLHNGLTEAMKQFYKQGGTRPKFSNGLLDTLEDFDHLMSNRPVLLRTTSDGRPEVDAEQLEILKAFWQDSEKTSDRGGQLKRITYLSKFARPFTNDELRKVGEISVSNNRIKNITGMLLCAEETFYQIIEGYPSDIDELYAKICSDPRHTHIQTLKEEFGIRESERQFPIWSMRTVNLSELTDHFFAQQLKQMIQMAGNHNNESDAMGAMADNVKTEDDNSDSWSEWDVESTDSCYHYKTRRSDT
jgi:hypothetical protein